jgi:2-polyprenyl-3-methyl-5-hydroxy-6-metoxy-1,4-benzoquinol methylase
MSGPIPCPICGAVETVSKGLKNGFRVVACKQCGHWWADGVTPLQSASDFLSQYSNFSPAVAADELQKLGQGEHKGGHTERTDRILRFVLERVGWSGTSHLDVGCGSGYLLGKSKMSGLEVQGIEPGPWADQVAKRWQISIEKGFLRECHYKNGFDLVTATDVIEHQADPIYFLRILASNTSPGGLLVLTFPCVDSFNARILGLKWCMVAPPTHCQFFSHKSATQLAQRCGLEIISWHQFNAGGFPILSRSALFTHCYSRILHALGVGDQLLIALQRVP